MRWGLSGPGFCGGFVLRKFAGSHNFSVQFVRVISHFKGIGYTINVATDCVLGCQPSHGWQLCFPL